MFYRLLYEALFSYAVDIVYAESHVRFSRLYLLIETNRTLVTLGKIVTKYETASYELILLKHERCHTTHANRQNAKVRKNLVCFLGQL